MAMIKEAAHGVHGRVHCWPRPYRPLRRTPSGRKAPPGPRPTNARRARGRRRTPSGCRPRSGPPRGWAAAQRPVAAPPSRSRASHPSERPRRKRRPGLEPLHRASPGPPALPAEGPRAARNFPAARNFSTCSKQSQDSLKAKPPSRGRAGRGARQGRRRDRGPATRARTRPGRPRRRLSQPESDLGGRPRRLGRGIIPGRPDQPGAVSGPVSLARLGHTDPGSPGEGVRAY